MLKPKQVFYLDGHGVAMYVGCNDDNDEVFLSTESVDGEDLFTSSKGMMLLYKTDDKYPRGVSIYYGAKASSHMSTDPPAEDIDIPELRKAIVKASKLFDSGKIFVE